MNTVYRIDRHAESFFFRPEPSAVGNFRPFIFVGALLEQGGSPLVKAIFRCMGARRADAGESVAGAALRDPPTD